MTKEDLLGKELSNLYAIGKQVNHYFNENDTNFLSKREQELVSTYKKFSAKNEQETHEHLRALQVNPGNTTDSIVAEITENLNQIATEKGTAKKIRELSYMMSFNRLVAYHTANMENIEYLLED